MDANVLDKVLGGISQDELIDRIKRCQTVIDKLTTDDVWQIVLEDARTWVTRLDATWQETYDEKQLANLRVLKLAYSHISKLPTKYAEDLKAAQNELDRRRNTDSTIQKDYDLETKLEGSAT